MAEPIERLALNPQPLPPRDQAAGPIDPVPWSEAFSFEAAGRTLSRTSAATEVSAKLRDLTLTSLIAPWEILPLCFYSRQLVCTTYTDCNGDWECCFNWWPLHVRHGRFRFDARPDIIIRVTQVINGVSTVIYMDPLSSTRWNVSGATINLSLNDPRVVCGQGCHPGPLLGHSQASLLQVGMDPTWTINQANGLFETATTTNAAFGGSLYLRGDFSLDLKTAGLLYYRLQWKPQGAPDTSFQPILTGLSALRAAPFGSFSDYPLGPHTVAGVSGLYEVQDAFHWWLMPGVPGGPGTVIGLWDTSFQTDEGSYVLRMDMFDAAGAPLGSIEYPDHGGNGSGIDPRRRRSSSGISTRASTSTTSRSSSGWASPRPMPAASFPGRRRCPRRCRSTFTRRRRTAASTSGRSTTAKGRPGEGRDARRRRLQRRPQPGQRDGHGRSDAR